MILDDPWEWLKIGLLFLALSFVLLVLETGYRRTRPRPCGKCGGQIDSGGVCPNECEGW